MWGGQQAEPPKGAWTLEAKFPAESGGPDRPPYPLPYPYPTLPYAGRSGLAVACLTAVREIPDSNRAVGSCDLQPWARAVCTLPAVLRLTTFYPPWDGK